MSADVFDTVVRSKLLYPHGEIALDTANIGDELYSVCHKGSVRCEKLLGSLGVKADDNEVGIVEFAAEFGVDAAIIERGVFHLHV